MRPSTLCGTAAERYTVPATCRCQFTVSEETRKRSETGLEQHMYRVAYFVLPFGASQIEEMQRKSGVVSLSHHGLQDEMDSN